MRSRKIYVTVFSYPEDFHRTLSLKRIAEITETIEFRDEFISSRSLDDILTSYADRLDVFASFVDEIRWYRVVIRDHNRRVVLCKKA